MLLQLLRSPCQVDVSLQVDKYARPAETKRSEAWLFIDALTQVNMRHNER